MTAAAGGSAAGAAAAASSRRGRFAGALTDIGCYSPRADIHIPDSGNVAAAAMAAAGLGAVVHRAFDGESLTALLAAIVVTWHFLLSPRNQEI